MESLENNVAFISQTNLNPQADFWYVNIFQLVLSGYSNQSHDFTNLVLAT